jgi:hypothetical protein
MERPSGTRRRLRHPALQGVPASPARRLFLAELLTSYVHVASGSFWVRTPGAALLELLGRRWYRLARFAEARRMLNLVADRHLSSHRERWFPGLAS